MLLSIFLSEIIPDVTGCVNSLLWCIWKHVHMHDRHVWPICLNCYIHNGELTTSHEGFGHFMHFNHHFQLSIHIEVCTTHVTSFNIFIGLWKSVDFANSNIMNMWRLTVSWSRHKNYLHAMTCLKISINFLITLHAVTEKPVYKKAL